jgi:geranyl-CoA carboxylase alpha subunit
MDVAKLLKAASDSGAQAIHPGYGFLSENAGFAAAVAEAGLIFVGPPASAISAMGDKARARQRMAGAGVPVVPGYDGEAQDEEVLTAEATRIGLPVMVKASAGGGGRGMRLVTSMEDLGGALRSAASEATKAFGNGRLILERAVVEPRHVEIQVLADGHGHVIHLGERDCTVQRRHQKILEESPSPAVDAALREHMGAAAVAVAREIGYVGAGTVEFLLDPAGHFYFMEMNTRLQVEHPVTELVTGLDLVELQLRVARGEELPLVQADVAIRGHAIEARLCAEEPADDFLPRSGDVLDWAADALVRTDHAVATGMVVSPWYDSMLAKVIAHGTTRAEAVDRLAAALDRTTLLGVATNRTFLRSVLRHPEFVEGSKVSTAFVGRNFADGASRAAAPDARLWSLAAWLSIAGAPEAEATPDAWRNWSTALPLPSRWRLQWLAPQALGGDKKEQSGHVQVTRDRARVAVQDASFALHGRPVPPRRNGSVDIDGSEVSYRYVWDGAVLWLHTSAGDYVFRCRRRDSARAGSAADASNPEVRASINGRVIEVAVEAGATVQAGQRLVVLEAMKMEHEVRAPRAGRVAAVAVKKDDQVAPGQWLVRIEGES